MNRKLSNYIRERGLTAALVAQTIGVTRQAVEQYGDKHMLTAKTLKKIAAAMTELGAPTTVVDLAVVMMKEEEA